MKDFYHSQKLRWALWIGFALAWFYMLGTRTLVPTDEGRYAEMAREMLASGDWVTPRLNGIKYFEKPPLQAWMNTISFALFGLGEWQARLWTGLSGFIGIIFTAIAGHKVFGARNGFYAALILVSSFWWAAMGHINTLDMGLSGMMTVSLAALLIAQRDGSNNRATQSEQRNWMLLCWAAMALAVLSKGLIGIVLPGAVLVLYTIFSGDWKIWSRLHLGKGLLVFFAICTPWFVLVSQKNPEFLHFFFIHEHFQRFLTKIHARTGPWYYFIPLFIAGIMPWLFAMPQSFASALQADANENRFKPRLLLLIWAVFIFFFFSYSSSKLPSYILPIFPATALLLAYFLERAAKVHFLLLAVTLLLICVGGLPFVATIPDAAKVAEERHLAAAFMPWIYATCAVGIVGAVLALRFAWRGGRDQVVLCIAITGFACGQIATQGVEVGGRYRAGFEVIPAIQANLKPEMKLYAVGLYEQCIPFYVRRTMVLVEHMDELEFGLKQEPHLWLPKREDFIAVWRSGPPAMAIVRPEVYKQLQAQGLPMQELARDTRRVVIVNRSSTNNSHNSQNSHNSPDSLGSTGAESKP